MKKLFIFIPVIFLLSFFQNCMMAAYAFETSDFIGRSIYDIVADDFDQGYDDALNTFKSYEHILYFNANVANFDGLTEGRIHYYSYVLPISSYNTFTTSLADDGSCYTIEFGSSVPDNCRVANYNFNFSYSDNLVTSYGGSSSFYNYFIYNSSITRVEYYPHDKEIKFYNGETLIGHVTDIFNVQSTIEDLPCDYLDVDVEFSPALSGEVDRTLYIDDNGVIYYKKGFTMQVTNNSGKAIQYRMAILPGTQTEIMNSAVTESSDTDTIFYYFSNEWVYDGDLSNESNYANGYYQKYHKSSDWHYVAKGETDSQYFNWSQIPINDKTTYTVVVQAILTDYDIATNMWTSSLDDDEAWTEYKQLMYDDCEYVFTSTFSVNSLGDIQYDYTDNSNGVMPYSSNSDFQRYAFSYSAVEDDSGAVDYNDVNLYDDTDSWYNKTNDCSSFDNNFDNGSYNANDFNYGINGFSNNVGAYLSFVNYCFSFFPSWFWSVIAFGLFAIIFMGILKFLR